MARFWVQSKQAEATIREAMSDVQDLVLIDEHERDIYRIRYPDRKFGDLIYWANGGAAIYPDFWHGRRQPLGMHGYRREIADNHGAFIYAGADNLGNHELESVEMVDVFQTAAYSLFHQPLTGTNVCGTPLQTAVAKR